MNIILAIIELIENVLNLADRLKGQKSRGECLRVVFHCSWDINLVPYAEMIIQNCGDTSQTIEHLFVSVGIFRPKEFPIVVRWGERELPNLVHDKNGSCSKITLRIAERGTLSDIVGKRFIRFGCITEMGGVHLSHFLRRWEKVELRQIVSKYS